MKPSRIQVFVGLAFLLAASLPSQLHAQRDQTHGAEAADIRTGTKFAMPFRTGEFDITGLSTPFFFKSNGDSITSLRVCIRYDASRLTFESFDKTTHYNWTGKADSVVQYGGGSTGYVAVKAYNVAKVVFNDTLFTFKWKPKCFADGTSDTLEYFDTLTVHNNDFTIWTVPGTFEPDTTKVGGAGIYAYTGDIYPVGATISASDTGLLPILITNNFAPSDTVKATVWYNQTDLQYVGYQTSDYGCLSGPSGLTVDSSSNGDTLKIAWRAGGGCDKSIGVDTLLKLKFWNRHDDSANIVYRDTVKVLSWRQIDCSSAMVEESTPAAAVVTTPEFTATISIKTQTFQEDRLDSLQAQFVNNHVVDMNVSDSDPDKTRKWASFHLLESAFDPTKLALKVNGSCVRPGTETPLTYKWTEESSPPSGSRIFRQGSGSHDLDIHSAAYSCAYLKMDTEPVDATVKDTADLIVITNTEDLLYGLDCKLKARGRPTVIYPQNVKSDNHLTLADGVITIANGGGGGGSCPFVSVWNGRSFVEENTILTQSEFTADGIAVKDFYPLETQPRLGSDGMYRLRLEEREDEVTYLDDIRLLRVYTDRSVSVTPDGEFFYEQEKLRPMEAVDYRGDNVLETVIGNDQDAYTSGEPGWLIVSYLPEYEVNGRVFAGHVVAAKDPCNEEKVVPTLDQLTGKVGPIKLAVSYRQAGGDWVQVDATPPRDQNTPTFSATDLTIRAGERIDVRYEWQHRWVVDALPLVVAASDKPRPFELIPLAAFHSATGQVTKAAKVADNEFVVLKKGESLELQFPAGGRPNPNSNAYFVVAAKGYYTPYGASEGTTLPTTFALHPNYPNPFNASTQVAFALPVESKVDIGVFNVLGQKVRTLVSSDMPAGEHLITWDGANDQGTGVASGTYFVRMLAGDYEEKRKMTLLK